MKTILAMATVTGLVATLAAAIGPPGRSGEPAATGETIKEALDTAIGDERHAIAFYAAVMSAHGERRPFANIIRAERRHEAALLAQYERLGLTPPDDDWRSKTLAVPATFREACDAAVVAEVRNARIYEKVSASVEDEQVLAVFDNLRRASIERHLRAFRRHGSGWERLDPEDFTPTQAAQRDKAIAARDAMFGALLGELSATMAKGGPAAAIEVCSDRAPAVAAETEATYGVRIGRTSWKLRNPGNAPPVWAELMIDERPTEPRFVADRSGRLGALTPIRLAAACVTCHGAPEQLAPGVRGELDRSYPSDRATGFAEGDLRGWFWIEVLLDARSSGG